MSAAQRFSSGLGGAGAGATIGSAIAPGIGTIIGGALGGLGGFLFGGGPDVPDIQFSPESLARLDEEFPELAAQIRANQILSKDYNTQLSALAARGGVSASELQQANQQMSQLQAAQSMSGNAGNPMANAMLADAYSRITNPMYDAGFNRLMQGYSTGSQIGQGITSQYGQLGQMANAAKQANIQAAMERDAARAGQQMAQYTAGRQDMAGLMQGLGGIAGAGFQAYMDPYASHKLFGTELPQNYGQNIYYTGTPGMRK